MGGKLFLKRLFEEYEEDDVTDSAAALGYYFVYSLFPFLFFLVALAAYVPLARSSVSTMLDRVHPLLPQQVMSIVDTHLRALVMNQRPHLLTVGIIVTLYTSSRGVDACRELGAIYKAWRTGEPGYGPHMIDQLGRVVTAKPATVAKPAVQSELPLPGTIAAIVADYLCGDEYAGLKPSTQQDSQQGTISQCLKCRNAGSVE